MTVTRFSPVRSGFTAMGGGTIPGGSPLPGAGTFPGIGAGRPGGIQLPSVKVDRDENRGGGGDSDDSRGGGGGNSGVDLRSALRRDIFETGPLRPVGAPAPAVGAAAVASKNLAAGGQPAPLRETGEAGTANAGQKNPVQQLVDLFKKLLEFLTQGAHRDENDTDDSKSGGGIADGDPTNTGVA